MDRLERIEIKIDELYKDLNGNHHEGLKQTVAKMQVQNENIASSLLKIEDINEDIRKSLSAIHKFNDDVRKDIKRIDDDNKEIKKHTKITRFFEEHKKIFAVFLIGVLVLIGVDNINTIVDFFKSLFL